MKHMIATLFFGFLLANATSVAALSETNKKQAYEGHYWNEEKDGIFKLQLTGDGIEGITVWGTKPQNDIHNPDPNKRDRTLKGIKFLWGFTYDHKKNRWKGGKVYDPNTGKTYDAKMSLENSGQTLKMRGYIGMAMFGRTAKFERVTVQDWPLSLSSTSQNTDR